MRLLGNKIGSGAPLVFMAGPCVIESEDMAMRTGDTIAGIADRLGCQIIYKSSFDKANRTSGSAYRGPGISAGLEILAKVKATFNLPIITDIHEAGQIDEVAEVADVLQTPAFLARQTDFIEAVARAGKPMNVKKAQFMAPEDMANVVAKIESAGNMMSMVCERGTSFGYGNLVVDMRGIDIMRKTTGRPVIFDATHSVQRPGGLGNRSGGDRSQVPALARAAVAVGVDGVFIETHPDPDSALSDGPNSIRLDRLAELIGGLMRLHDAAWAQRMNEDA